jgi:hypothetical protein
LLNRVWQVSPPPFNPGFINFNLPTFPGTKEQIAATTMENAPILEKVVDLHRLGLVAQNPADHDAYHARFVTWNRSQEYSAFGNPHSILTQPVYDTLFNATAKVVVAFVFGVVPWDRYVSGLLPEGVLGISLILRNSCGQAYTYELTGNTVSP